MTRSKNLLEAENNRTPEPATYRLLLCTALALLATALIGCGSGSDRSEQESHQSTAGSIPGAEVPFPDGSGGKNLFRGFDQLPDDRLMPGEELNSEGKVDSSTASDRAGMTGIDPLSGNQIDTKLTSAEPAPTRTRFASGALSVSGSELNTVVDNEGLRIKADPSQDVDTAYAAYRLNSTSGDPALLTTDINLPEGADYFIALADYGAGKWRWKGPFSDGRLRFQPDKPGDLISDRGNLFVAVVTTSMDGVDVTGIGAQLADSSDSTAPSAPTNLRATPAAGGVLLEWQAVGNPSDLAGYRIYSSSTPFSQKSRAFSNSGKIVSGRSDYFLRTDTEDQLQFRVTAVDTSGNESPLSEGASATPGSPADQSKGQLKVDRIAGPVGSTVDLDASSIQADSYDWDTDGDGQFEETGVSSATRSGIRLTDNAGQPASGLLRPAVRAKNSEGEVTLFTSASVLFPRNVRPEIETVRFISDGSPISSGTAPVNAQVEVHFDDPDGKVTQVEVDSDNNRGFDGPADKTIFDSSGLSSPQLTSEIELNPPQQINVRIFDHEGGESWAQAVLPAKQPEVPNLAPRITEVKARPKHVLTGITEFKIEVSATDPDGDDSEMEYIYKHDDNDSFPGTYAYSDQSTSIAKETELQGHLTAEVRVRDSSGLVSQATTDVVSHEFTETAGPRSSEFIDTNDSIDTKYTASLLLDQRPALVYSRSDASEGKTECAISVSFDQTASSKWQHGFITDSPGNASCQGLDAFPNLPRDSHHTPTIAFYNQSTSPPQLKFAQADNSNGLGGSSSWSTSKVKDLSGADAVTDAHSIRLTRKSDRYLIAFVDNNSLWIAITTDEAELSPSGPGDWVTYELIPGPNNSGEGPVGEIDLTSVRGGSAIAFYEEDDQHLNWITEKALSKPEGADDWNSSVLIDDSSANIAPTLSASVAIKCGIGACVSFSPMITYHDKANNRLRLATSDTPRGDLPSNWDTQELSTVSGKDPVFIQSDSGRRDLSPNIEGIHTQPRPTIIFRDGCGKVLAAQNTARDALGDWHWGRVADFNAPDDFKLRALSAGHAPGIFLPEKDGTEHEFMGYVRPLK